MNNGGDVLAKGGRKCQFPPMGGNVTQERWDKMFEEDKSKEVIEERSGEISRSK